MAKYKYLKIESHILILIDSNEIVALNKLGADGWELVGVVVADQYGSKDYYLKKKV